MAAPKKKVVSKDDLRRLMKAKSSETNISAKIIHPLAKYNSIGQIVCTVCNVPVKSAVLWNVHLQNKSHKQNVEAGGTRPHNDNKRKSNPIETFIPVKKPRGDSSDDKTRLKNSKGHTTTHDPSAKPLKSCLKNSIVSHYSSSEGESDEETDAKPTQPSALPSDFFDSKNPDTTSTDTPVEKPVISEALPEGFFDDPVMDAKVRKVEYRNKMEDEWESFQKAVQQQTTITHKTKS